MAQPQIVNRRKAVAAHILLAAGEVDGDVLVLGPRGRRAVRSLMLGSVANAVRLQADSPVLVVPSPPLAEERQGWAVRAQLTADVA